MKKSTAAMILVFIIGLIIGISDIEFTSHKPDPNSSPPTCTNTTIDAYYKCQPTTPIMLRR